MSAISQPSNSFIPAFLRDSRVLQAIGQFVFLILLVLAISQLVAGVNEQLQAKNLTPNFSFLNNPAGFDIGEKPDWYTRDNSYGEAYIVGVINTLRVVSVGLVATTLLGILFGIFLLSSNWLLRTISRAYVEILRNTPLLVQLFVWYFIVMFSLPQIRDAIALPPEGRAFIAIRLIAYVVEYLAVRRYVRRFLVDAPRRIVLMYGSIAAIVVTEIAFHFLPESYALGDFVNSGFLVYVAISVVAFAAAWFYLHGNLRYQILAIVGGQFFAIMLFYFGVWPASSLRPDVYPAVYISIRGFAFPEILPTNRFVPWVGFVTVGLVLAGIMWAYFGRINETTGRVIPRGRYALISIIGFTVIGWLIVGLEPLPTQIPVDQDGTVVFMPLQDAQEQNLLSPEDVQLYSTQPILINLPQERRNRGGILTGFNDATQISPEFMALFLGLVIYTSAFIAEIVRAGIQAVPRGQIEAARSIGLSTTQTLNMIVLPQALRVIIPPLTNQYLNIAKNSSLALAIAYADLFQIMTTSMNQSGQSVTGIAIIMVTYLSMSLIISLVMNLINSRFQLVTR
ncbi:MAG: ABC transporter permease subunit [Anaerolineaceae bacterium]|nr:ABC transporter permease subunit [Anaerolineaceae bacterium]